MIPNVTRTDSNILLEYTDHKAMYGNAFDALLHATHVARGMPFMNGNIRYSSILTTRLNIHHASASRSRKGTLFPENWILHFHLYSGLPLDLIYKIAGKAPMVTRCGQPSKVKLRDVVHKGLKAHLAYDHNPVGAFKELFSRVDALVYHVSVSSSLPVIETEGKLNISPCLDALQVPRETAYRKRRSLTEVVPNAWLLRLHQYSGVPFTELFRIAGSKPPVRPHLSFGFD